MKRTILFIIVTIFLSWNLSAQSGIGVEKAGNTSMTFLQIGVSAKAAGLGNAYNSLSHGVESIFLNPAGLTEMSTNFEAFVSSTQWFADIKYLAGAIAWNAHDYGAIGIHFITVDYGTIHGAMLVDPDIGTTTDSYILTGDVKNVGAYSFGLTYVKQISDRFAMGGTIKYVGQQLGQLVYPSGQVSDNEASKVVLDFGVKYYLPLLNSVRLAMSMRNFSTSVKYQSLSSPLPLVFSMGLGMNIMNIFNSRIAEDNALMLSVEFVHPNNYTERVSTGIEYTFMKTVSIRGGYETNHDVLSWSGGAGLAQTIAGIQMEIDYSYSDTKYFGGVNRFALVVGF